MSRKKVSVQGYYVRRKGMIHDCLTDVCMRNLSERQDGERKPVLIQVPGSCKRLALRKRVTCAKNMGAHVQRSSLKYQRYEKTGQDRILVQPRKAQGNV